MKFNELKDINRLLIIRLSSLGDILLTTPLLRLIKTSFPHIEIDFILTSSYKDVLVNNPYINNIILYSKDEPAKSIKELRSNNYDLVIDLQNNFRSKKIRRRIRGEKLVFKKPTLKKLILVKTKINLLKDAEQIPVRYANVFDDIKLDDDGIDLLSTSEPSITFDPNKKYVGICPGAKHFTKMWPIDYFIKLCRLLIKDGWNVVMFGGESDRKICAQIWKELPEVINLQNNDDLLQTAADMKFCSAIFCNDSGLMHTASGVKVPVLVFFGSTVREFGFTPFNNKHLILENSSLSCRPCSHIGKYKCPKVHFNCMNEITPQMAFDKLHELLSV